MIEYVLDYMESKEQFVSKFQEVKALKKGISMYLEENGIPLEEKREYFHRYIERQLELIEPDDLKAYFMEYPTISKIKQIAIEYSWDGNVSQERVDELYALMTKLNNAGLYNKYIPAVEVKAILGRYF